MPKPSSQNYPPPLIIPPTSGIHKSTFIILHGRGSTADKFASPLLSHLVSPLADLALVSQPQPFHSHFPDTKFVFPTASRRRAIAYNRSLIHQWFDMYPLDQYPPEHKEHVQLPGLRESAEYVHGLLQEAVSEVGAKNVILMGLSQGCATGLISLLLWSGERLGGFVGMCGWLPLRESMIEALEETGRDKEEDDVFEVEVNDEDRTKIEQVIHWLREEIDYPAPDTNLRGDIPSFHDTSVFLAHGTEDLKVPCELGKLAADFLKNLNINAVFEKYLGLGHWYSEKMLRDIVDRLKHLEGTLHEEADALS